ncbi:MAG TPA: DUF1992 domain-containing protein [Dehalococcoidia bacterium]|nr:DUF1992 domain-containing protein [Dehalococcoidia bacterium]
MAEEARKEPARRPPWPLRQTESVIEQRIREAAEAGAFDNLPTRGKPVPLDLKDAYDRDAWFVNRTLKSLGAVPAWMELGKEIDAAEARFRWLREDFFRWLGETRAALRPLSPAEQAARRPGVELRYEDRCMRYRKLAEELRGQIERFNHEVPVRTLEKPGVWVAHEISRLQEPFAALRDELGWDQTADAEPPVSGATAAPASEEAGDRRERGRRLLERWRRGRARR